MLHSCTCMATVGVKGLEFRRSDINNSKTRTIRYDTIEEFNMD